MLDLCCWVLPICRDLGDFYDDVYWSYDMYILEMYDLYPLRLLRNFIYACYLNLMWRRGVYFLNIYIIRVYYRFNRNRALQKASQSLKNVWHDVWDYWKRPRVIGGKWIFRRTNLITSRAEEVWCRLMELQKFPSVVGCKELQEDGRHSNGWRGKGGSLWCYMVWLEAREYEAWKEQRVGWWLNWHYHKFKVKVGNVVVWLKIVVLKECKIGARFGQIGGQFWVLFYLFLSTFSGARFVEIGT